jgi:hypothetical protein
MTTCPDRTERRFISTLAFLTQAGRLQLVNSVLSSLPTYAIYSLKVPIAVLEFIEQGGTVYGEVQMSMLKGSLWLHL